MAFFAVFRGIIGNAASRLLWFPKTVVESKNPDESGSAEATVIDAIQLSGEQIAMRHDLAVRLHLERVGVAVRGRAWSELVTWSQQHPLSVELLADAYLAVLLRQRLDLRRAEDAAAVRGILAPAERGA